MERNVKLIIVGRNLARSQKELNIFSDDQSQVMVFNIEFYEDGTVKVLL